MTERRKPMHPRARLVKILRASEQTITDVASWNENRPDEAPMDCEPERIMAEAARRGIAAWDRGDMEAFGQIAAELAAYGRKMLAAQESADA